jgi:hypothetical protein
MLTRTTLGLIVAALLGGCVGSGAESPQGLSGLGGADLVVVQGVVISDELFPVPEAVVTLASFKPAMTDLAGRFAIVDVPIGGPYELSVNATGYEPYSVSLDVSGSIENFRIPLIGIPGQSPYAATYIHVGFEACNFSLVYSAGPLGSSCPFGTPNNRFRVEVGAHWNQGVHELDWETSEDMIFASVVSTSDRSHGMNRDACGTNGQRWDWCPAMIWGKAPLRIIARPNDTEYAKQYAIDGAEVWPGGENYTSRLISAYSGYLHTEINGTFYNQCVIINNQFNVPERWGCPFGVGYSTGIRITYYHTTFYHQDYAGRLEDFSAMPDA